MMLIRRLRIAAVGIAAGSLMFVAHELKAQFGWGTNAPPCNGPCAPGREWGYYKTSWHRWPSEEITNGMPVSGGAMSGAGAPSVELPDPRNEAEIRIPSTSTTRPRGSQSMQGGGGDPGFAPIPADRDFGPATRGAEPTPRALPRGGLETDEFAPTMPPADPQPDPMSMNRSRSEATPNAIPNNAAPNQAAPLPRFKLRSAGADNVAGREPAVIQGPRLVAEQREEKPTFTAPQQRPSILVPAAPAKTASEPELLIPTSTSKPMEGFRSSAEPASTSGNPLRSDVVQTAVFEEDNLTTINEGGPSPASGAVRSNPLRR